MSQTWKDYQGKDPIWCAGCGDFGVLRGMQMAVADLGLAKHDVALVTGIGCSGNITAYFQSYGFHGIHGRALPAATGIKMANPDLTVLVAGGDGDGFGIGLGHFMHAARRNVDVTYIVMDNQVYGLTKGQTSPTTPTDMHTKASPLGPMADPVRPIELGIAGGASFVAQAFSGDLKGFVQILQQAIAHKGFSLVNVQSPCVTYNERNTYAFFRENTRQVTHDPADRDAALEASRATDHVPVGILYQKERPVLPTCSQAIEDAGDAAAALERHAEAFSKWGDAFGVR